MYHMNFSKHKLKKKRVIYHGINLKKILNLIKHGKNHIAAFTFPHLDIKRDVCPHFKILFSIFHSTLAAFPFHMRPLLKMMFSLQWSMWARHKSIAYHRSLSFDFQSQRYTLLQICNPNNVIPNSPTYNFPQSLQSKLTIVSSPFPHSRVIWQYLKLASSVFAASTDDVRKANLSWQAWHTTSVLMFQQPCVNVLINVWTQICIVDLGVPIRPTIGHVLPFPTYKWL